MKNYIAIVKNSNNKVDKLQYFASKSDADAHVATYGGFVVDTPSGNIKYWVVDADAKTVTFDKSKSDSDVAKRVVMSKINELEAEVTPRRIRDAFADPTWMNAQEAKIATERGKL